MSRDNYESVRFSQGCGPCLPLPLAHSRFSQMHKVGNIGSITNFVFSYIYSFLSYFNHIILVYVKLDASMCDRVTFQGCRLH